MKKSKLVVASLAAFMLASSLTGCGGGSKPINLDFSFLPSLESGKKAIKVGETAQIDIISSGGDSKEEAEIERTYSYESSDTSVATVDEFGEITAVGAGDVRISVIENASEVQRNLFLTVYSDDPANGIVSFSGESLEEKANILGSLEKYAMDNSLTGLSLYENGGYVMYNPRIQKGADTYIPGYGFGIQREGNITEDMASETKAEWKRYYHTASSTDEKTINALNSKESSVSDLYAIISSSYWDIKMNSTKDGYDWYGVLAKDNRPIPGVANISKGEGDKLVLDSFVPSADPHSSATSWKFHVRTGEDGLTYRTLSSKPFALDFNNRQVKLEDYVYGYKMLLTQSFGLSRGSEHAANEKKGYAFVGSQAYYNATKTSAGTDDDAFAKNVHFFTGEDEGGAYIVVDMPKSYDPFFGMYYMTSNLYQPIPKEFIISLGGGDEKKGVERYGSFVQDPAYSPVDTILSLGPRILEYWEEDKTIAFKTNDTWFQKVADPNIYRNSGVKYTIYPGAKEDNTLVFKEFLAGNLDGAGIPTVEYLKQYRDDPRTTTTTGDTVFKLNMNTTSKERWVELFGEDGIVTQTSQSDYWDVKPWMGNKNFVRGLNASVDRLTYANNRGNIPSNNFFSSDYLSDPENGISYNNTEAHERAMAEYYPETAGYNLEASKIFFRHAVDELVENGELELGTRKKPTKISIECWWMYEYMIEDDGAEIGKYIEDAFNDPQVCGGKVKLSVNHKAVTQWDDIYYKHLMVGQFDIGFGSVSGNPYDPLAFLDNLFQDGSSQYTLCWGDCDTEALDEDLVYDGRAWSFQGLWNAANTYANLVNGEVEPLVDFALAAYPARQADGKYVVTLYVKQTELEDGTDCHFNAACIFATSDSTNYSDYVELYVYEDGSDDITSGNSSWVVEPALDKDNQEIPGVKKLTITFSNECMEALKGALAGDAVIFGVDMYADLLVPSVGYADAFFFVNTCWSQGSFPVIPEA